ncbi:MAG: hypothetical protein IJD28_08155 [Deferribacterales bacterium]|nr:hypothetical protein [Deferribacterales bacterium]
MKKFIILIISVVLTACAPTLSSRVMDLNQSQLEKRSYQARVFDTTDKKLVMRAIISTMQDLGFIIDTANEKFGTLSGRTFSTGASVTITVRESNQTQTTVRINAQQGNKLIEDPIAYQNFFNALAQSLFLEAHEIK